MNAIIAAATGYSDTDLEPFLASVGRTCTRTKVFLIVLKRDLKRIELLRRRYPFIEPVYVHRRLNRGTRFYSWLPRWIARHFIGEDYSTCGSIWSACGRYSLHISLERYFIALELVRAHRDSLASVLLTDSRDVVLQEDPFRRIGANLVSGLEENTIGRCSVNSKWLTHVYGVTVHTRIAKHRIVCSGVTIGPIDAMEQYLVEMCREIWKCLPNIAAGPWYDQCIHNYLIYSDRVTLDLTDNRHGIIATLLSEAPHNIRTDAATGVVTVHGLAPAIVHQYDRHASVAAFVRERLNKPVLQPV